MQPYQRAHQGKNFTQEFPIPGKEHLMTKAHDGAFVFTLDCWTRLNRFLILGADKPTYYASQQTLAKENAQAVEECLKQDGIQTVEIIAQTSIQALASNNDPAIYALAMASVLGDEKTRKYAFARMPDVCRIGTHLFHFAAYREALGGGWGRGMRQAVTSWYNEMPVSKLSYQVIKYKQRDGWSHKDLLRLAHPVTQDQTRDSIFRWIVGGSDALQKRSVKRAEGKESKYPSRAKNLPDQIQAAMDIFTMTDVERVVNTIVDYNLPHECVPNEFKDNPLIWEALLQKMPLEAMTRNLAKMTVVGLLTQMSDATKLVVNRLEDQEMIKKSKMHPMGFLKALSTYAQGHGALGKLTWQPMRPISDALDGAFYKAFGNVEPTGQNIGLFLDISGSMGWTPIPNTSLTPRVVSAAMAMITAAVEKNVCIMGFADKLINLDISPKMRLDTVVKKISDLPFGSTDISLPFITAMKQKMPLDAFVIYTDSATNHFGSLQPSVALKKYRQTMNKPEAKLIVVGMVSNGFSVADPTDCGSLDVVGFSTDTPKVMSAFIKGEI